MNIGVFGASGAVGERIVNEALTRGHAVTAFARDRSRVGPERAGVAWKVANILDADGIGRVIGDLDILVSNNGQAPQLLRNDGGNANHWLEILLIGTKSNRDAVGARVKLSAGDLVLYDQRKGGMSYQSAQDPRLHCGLGQRTTVDSIEITWPSGMTTQLANVKADQIIAVKEGVGIVERPFPRVLAK